MGNEVLRQGESSKGYMLDSIQRDLEIVKNSKLDRENLVKFNTLLLELKNFHKGYESNNDIRGLISDILLKMKASEKAKDEYRKNNLKEIQNKLNEYRIELDANLTNRDIEPEIISQTNIENFLSSNREEKDGFYLSKFISGTVYDSNNFTLQEVNLSVYIRPSTQPGKMDMLIDNNGANTVVEGVPLNQTKGQEVVNFVADHVGDNFFSSQDLQYSEYLGKQNEETQLIIDELYDYITGDEEIFKRDKAKIGAMYSYLELLGGTEELNRKVKDAKKGVDKLTDLQGTFKGTLKEKKEAFVNNPETEIVAQTQNIKNFLSMGQITPESYKQLDLDKIEAILYSSYLNNNKDDKEKQKIKDFIEQTKKLYENYSTRNFLNDPAYKTNLDVIKIDESFNKIAVKLSIVGGINSMEKYLEDTNKLKNKPFSELVGSLKKLNLKVDEESKKEKKDILIALTNKIEENFIYIGKDQSNKFKAMSSTNGTTDSVNAINNGMNQEDLNTIMMMLTTNRQSIEESKSMQSPADIFDEVLGEYKFKKSDGTPYVTGDFSEIPVAEGDIAYSGHSKGDVEKNINGFSLDIDKKISELKKENNSKDSTNELKKVNLLKIEKLEIAKTFATNKNIFSTKAIEASKDIMISAEGKTGRSGISHNDMVTADSFIKDLESGKTVDFAISQMPKVIGVLILNWIIGFFKGSSPKLTAGLQALTTGLLGVSVFSDAHKANMLPGVSDFMKKANPIGDARASSGDTTLSSIGEKLGVTTTDEPVGINPLYSEAFARINSKNSEQNNLVPVDSFEEKNHLKKIFILTSNDPTFLSKTTDDLKKNMEPGQVFSMFNSNTQGLFHKHHITSKEVSNFVKLAINSNESEKTTDKTVLDMLLTGEVESEQKAKAYFPNEDLFNKKIESSIKNIPGLPIGATQFGDKEELKKTSLKAQVESVIDPDLWSSENQLNFKWSDIKNNNVFDANRLNIIKQVNEKLTIMASSNEKLKSNKDFLDIKTNYENLQKKHELFTSLDKLFDEGGYGFMGSTTGGITGLLYGSKEFLNGDKVSKVKVGEIVNIKERVTKIDYKNKLSDLAKKGLITETEKEQWISEVSKFEKKLNGNQESSLFALATSQENNDKDKSKDELKKVYIEKLKSNSSDVKTEVDEINNNLKPLEAYTDNTGDYIVNISGNGLIDGNMHAMYKLKLLKEVIDSDKSLDKDGILDEIKSGVESIEKLEQNLIKNAKDKNEELSKLKIEIISCTSLEELNKKYEKIEELRKSLFVGDNSSVSTILKGTNWVADYVGVSATKDVSDYNYFEVLQKQMKIENPTFSFEGLYPSRDNFKEVYREIKKVVNGDGLKVLEDVSLPTDYKNDLQVVKYIESINNSKKNIDKFKPISTDALVNEIGGLGIDKLERDLDKKVDDFIKGLIQKIKETSNKDDLVVYKNIGDEFIKKTGARKLGGTSLEWENLVGVDNVDENTREREKELLLKKLGADNEVKKILTDAGVITFFRDSSVIKYPDLNKAGSMMGLTTPLKDIYNYFLTFDSIAYGDEIKNKANKVLKNLDIEIEKRLT